MAWIWGTQERMMLTFYIEASRLVMVLITEMGNMWKMNQFEREKIKNSVFAVWNFRCLRKDLSKDTSH